MFIKILSELGTSLQYSKVFGITIAVNFLLYWFMLGAASLICHFLGKFYSPTIKNKGLAESSFSDSESIHSESQILLKDRYNKDTKRTKHMNEDIHMTGNGMKHRVLRYLGSIFSWVAWFTIACIPAWLSGFSIIPIWAGILLSVTVLITRFFISLYSNCPIHLLENKNKGKMDVINTMLHLHSKKIKFGFIFLLTLGVFLPLATYKSCFNNHVDPTFEVTFYNGKYIYSSALLRYMNLPKVCPPGPPCHLYATLPFDTSSGVFINVHTHIDVSTVTINYGKKVDYDTTGKLSLKQATSTYISPPGYDSIGERNIFNILLSSLESATEYILEISYSGKPQKKVIYKTLPSPTTEASFNLIYGGDLGISAASQKLTETAKEQNPEAIIIGGDFAYDDGESYCYHTLDKTLSMLEKTINESLQRLVPLIISVGNHDVGWNSMSKVSIPPTENGPSYYSTFVQHTNELKGEQKDTSVPLVSQRKTYHAHLIGNILNVALDPGYVSKYDGEQLTWLKKISEDNKQSVKFAIYHDPIVTACHEGPQNVAEGMKNWIPLFDDYKYMISFDHHTHYFKKTVPLKAMIPTTGGTVYLGSGDWGVAPTKCNYDNSKGIFTKTGPLNHIWVVNVNPTTKMINTKAILLDGTVIEPFSLKIDDYLGTDL